MVAQFFARRLAALLGAVVLLALLVPASPSRAFPVASDDVSYTGCGRVFPDPQAYWPSPTQAPTQSPWAKGNATCKAVDFLGWQETLDGLNFMADSLFPEFVEVYNLAEEGGRFDDVIDQANGDGMSAGLATNDLGRDRSPMYLVRVTDEEDTGIPIEEREHFAYTLSIHGIERAGIEGGIRAIEDLATWASCEKYGDADSPANCAQENAGPDNPHPILETMPEDSITAGEALKKSTVYFVLSNPDGWRRGDKQRAAQKLEDGEAEPGFFYQRYNGNGMDMNRDWPTKGFTFRPFTPWSEPETRSVGKALKDIKDKWTGGIDLHGQLIDRAFSFTLIGGSERPYDKDRRVLQFVKGAWADAETRLSWSPLIKSNDTPPACVEQGTDPQPNDPENCDPTERIYAVQWGTVWDTIDYTTTGSLGDWMDSPMGLDADGIDNEMSLSHLSNCGVGTCFAPDAEQLHVDGNKSLIYAMMHYSLIDENTDFNYDGRAAYLHNPDRIRNAGSDLSTAPDDFDAPPQADVPDIVMDHMGGDTYHEFEVKGPDQGVYNGGISATFSFTNLGAVSPGTMNELAIDMYRSPESDPPRRPGETDPEDENWQTVNTYYNQADTYQQAGAKIDVNSPKPGLYRLRVTGDVPAEFNVDLAFSEETAWPDPGQLPYNVSNMDFFDALQPFVAHDEKLVPVDVDDVLAGKVDLEQFDSLVAADNAFLPDYSEAVPLNNPQDTITANGEACLCAPGAGTRVGPDQDTPATSDYFEFDIEPGNALMEAKVTSETVVDPDLYLQRQLADGSWSSDVASGESGRSNIETLTYGKPRPGHYRLETHNWAGAPGTLDITIEFSGDDAAGVGGGGDYTRADRTAMAAIVKEFARSGGNLVLTDDSLRALQWMGLVGDQTIFEQTVYAGYIEFSADKGESSTYDDPLAANVNQPGAAEGDNHRHQITEPVPLGYSIHDAGGGDVGSMPQWGVDRKAWDDAGGRTVGVVGAEDVTLGELPLGKGVVRIAGSMLPVPTEEYDHPYGLESYGVTYSGYEVFRNLLDWDRDTGATDPDPDPDPDDGTGPADDDRDEGAGPADDDRPALPATGGGIVLAALATLGTGLLVRRRLRR